MLVRTLQGADQLSKVTAAPKLRGPVHLTGSIYGIQSVESPRGLGKPGRSSLESFSRQVQTLHLPPCRGAQGRRAVGSRQGWMEGPRPAGSRVGQNWATVRREVVREAWLGRPGSRGHPPFRKTQPEVAGSATFHLPACSNCPPGHGRFLFSERAELSTGSRPGFLPSAAFHKCSRCLLPRDMYVSA